ncbi:MAG TPA: coenzyme F420-0:L-glutamate ligase [Actinomycetota bacterium]|jgi:coenzyme F420-0:L-glutamate ligase/coenzyme F420-1:gamma-L-glutamate ligase|nr:coenzyme F420-0:L-glutamate ligase [Actinomycetota bacterium]
MTVEVIPVRGIPEVDAGDDIASLIAAALGAFELGDGDVVAVTQKIVSKAEGRVVPDEGKEDAVLREARRIVARRGDLLVAETRHGFVCANAGVDRSNVPEGFLSLLPEDPDAAAARIRAGLLDRTGRMVAVVVTDTFGRPWRRGVVNVAIGCDGLPALVDLRGTKDLHGRLLESTVVALADEVAAASGLVMAKDEGVPVAVIRGLRPEGPHGTARQIVRPRDEDLFRESPLASLSARRSTREFGLGSITREALQEAVAAALAAPVPHGSRHTTRPWLWMVLESSAARNRLLDAMGAAWARDLEADGVSRDVIDRRRAKSDALLGEAPVLAVPFLSMGRSDEYPDRRRREAEREMFLLATGAAVQNFMLALHAQGFASCWVSSTLFCKEETRRALGVGSEWLPMGAIAAGPVPSGHASPRPPLDPDAHLRLL